MKSSTGRWVSGDDFFDRETDLERLEQLVRDGNHVLLTGQRRMGKTSVARELGRRLADKDWMFLFSDVEGATCAEDAIAELAHAAHAVRPIATRLAEGMGRLFNDRVDEISALDFRVKFRAGLDAESWKRHGEGLLRDCAGQRQPVLLVIDELPIFLKRLLAQRQGMERVEEFLSWLRGVVQSLGDDAPVLMVSGSVGLEPLVRRLGIPDRINHLYAYRLGPWDRGTSIRCFERLAESNGLPVDHGVAATVYDALGIGIPHHVQSFFARLCDFKSTQRRDRITVGDVNTVYRTELLGPSGQNDLAHYETRLREALEDEGYTIAVTILAEAAIGEVFTTTARRRLEQVSALTVTNAPGRIAEAIDVLEHDGYLVAGDDGHRFSSRLLKDWWAARFRDHYTPLADRFGGEKSQEMM